MIIYDKHATDFFNLGLGPLTNVLKSTVHEERNGAFYLELTSLHDERLQENNIIKTDAGHLLKDQRFMIKKITDNHDGTCEVYAVHCSYLAQELTLKPQTYIAGATATQALIAWENAIYEPHPFMIYSDIETVATTSWSIAEVNNPRRALGGARGSILDVWGGEYQFDNYLVRLLKKRGTTAQTVLAYGRNITGFEMETNIDEVYTSIYPYAVQQGSEGKGDTLIAIDGLVVDVENIAEYPNRRTLPVDFSDKFDHDDAPTQAKLVEYAQKYITDNKVGVPKISMRVKFADLSKSADYADYKQLEQVNLCDEVRVIYPKLGVNTVAKVTKITWNCLTKSYDEIEIGEKRLSLGSKLNEQEKQIEEITTQVNHAQLSADGKNMIFYDLYGEDGLGEPTATKVGDSWFKPNGEQIDLYIWDGTIWREVLSNAIFNELSQKVEQAEQDILDAMDTAQQGLDKANQALQDSGLLADQLPTIEGLATSAQADALQAIEDALQAQGGVDSLQTDVSNLSGELTTKVSQTTFDTLAGTVSTQGTAITQNANDITQRATKTEVDTLSGTVTSLSSTLTTEAGKITALNTKTDGHTTQIGSLQSSYDGLSSTVAQVQTDLAGRVTTTAFSDYQQTVNGFMQTVQNDKADKTTVNALATQWQTTTLLAEGHTSQISSLGEQINLRLTKEQAAAEILKDNQVLDTRDTNEPPTWYYTNYPRQSVRELKLNSSIGLSGAGMYSTVTTDVGWSDSSGGNIEQTAKADNGVYQRRGNGASWSAWSRVADTSNILSQINLSTEGVLIQGKNIWLDGNTKINDAVIKTAHISDLAITSAKIADLAVTSAKIVSLDASKISVGTLTGFTINGATINGGEIRGNSAIYINDGSDNVVLTALHGFSTTRTVAANGVIRSGDWIYAGTNADGTWKAGFGFQGERLRTNYIDPIYNNGVLNIGQLSTTDAKVQCHLDAVFKRAVAVETALRLANQPSQPATTGMMSIWCGDGYAGYGIYATAPNGTSKSIAIWT